MKKANGIDNYRTCGEYEKAKSIYREQVLPHELWRSKETVNHIRGLLISKRKKPNGQWSLSQAAAQFLFDSEHVRKAIEKGYVVFEDTDGTVIAYHTITEVMKALSGIEPNPGTDFGPYYWLDAEQDTLTTRKPGEFGGQEW